MKRIINGRLVLEDQVVEQDIWIENDRIVALGSYRENGVSPELIDADGGLVLPGLIDIHSDYIERMINPRPTALLDFGMSLHELERMLLSQGITTMYHSLSLYKEEVFGHRAIRQPDNVRRLMDFFSDLRDETQLIRHRFHCRLEIDNLDQLVFIEQSIAQGKIHLLSFMDHTPGQGQYRDLEVYRKTLQDYAGDSPEKIEEKIIRVQQRPKLTMDRLAELSEFSHRAGVVVASHDDDTLDKLSLVATMGISISEFPITLEVALAARQRAMHVVLGAPNVLLGGSHSGNVSAKEAIAHGACNILCSDYYPAALIHSVFQLAQELDRPLPDMVRLASLGPAQALGLESDYGSVAVGKKADLLIVHPDQSNRPHITKVLVDGDIRLEIKTRSHGC